MKQHINEVIVVEGRDDIDAVSKAVNADIIATHGYGITKDTLERIKNAYETRGIIILTDPDNPGQRIRKRLTDLFPDAGQAYISRSEAVSKDDIGVENASPDVIAKALEAAGRTVSDMTEEYTPADMMRYGLSGGRGSRDLRDRLGRKLGIGYGNAAAFLKRLNGYGIERGELERLLTEIQNET
ncbi:MAG: ribonuclease M5 [Anaerovoracaceae bacterium]|jgi:ribonuclease M5